MQAERDHKEAANISTQLLDGSPTMSTIGASSTPTTTTNTNHNTVASATATADTADTVANSANAAGGAAISDSSSAAAVTGPTESQKRPLGGDDEDEDDDDDEMPLVREKQARLNSGSGMRRKKAKEPILEEDLIEGFSMVGFKTYEDLEVSYV